MVTPEEVTGATGRRGTNLERFAWQSGFANKTY
jgi:hypothetical protein